jgi:hypothetical protein
MTNSNKNGIFQVVKEVPQKIISYISGAVTRIFAPRDDDYPETGVQPFEGDPSDNKHH